MPLHQHHESILDSQELTDGDQFFKQMVSRTRSKPLPQGTVELSQNMRLESNEAAVREGLKKLTDNLLFSTPVTIPFVIPSGPLTNGNSFAMYASGVFSDPNDGMVLEVAIGAGGNWTEIEEAGGHFLSGGYNNWLRTRPCEGSPPNPLGGTAAVSSRACS